MRAPGALRLSCSPTCSMRPCAAVPPWRFRWEQEQRRDELVSAKYQPFGHIGVSRNHGCTAVSQHKDETMGLFSKDIKTMNDLFLHQLQDIYYAENQLVKALPKMAGKATDPQLKQGFLTHLEETKTHVQRLEQVFQMHGSQAKAVDRPAIAGIN